MSESPQAESFRSFLYPRLIVPWLVIGVLLVVLAANGWRIPSISPSVDPLLILGIAHVLLLWKILGELRSISNRLAAGE